MRRINKLAINSRQFMYIVQQTHHRCQELVDAVAEGLEM